MIEAELSTLPGELHIVRLGYVTTFRKTPGLGGGLNWWAQHTNLLAKMECVP
jgi:hypothetical protein